MKGLKYQLKNIQRDKMCILTFLLPIVVGLAINLLSGISFTSISETSFGILANDLSRDDVEWLQSNGTVTIFENMDDLEIAVNDPATQMIGVFKNNTGIETFLSGDELKLNRTIGDTLPQLFEERDLTASYRKTLIPMENNGDGLKSLLIVITMVTAMFMGCTFNAMNVITEKEEGIEFINDILPMSAKQYTVQKIALGFIGGILSTAITAIICMGIKARHLMPLILMIILSAFIAALTGLFIGRFSSGLMVGIVYIKIIMIMFLAPPILFYLVVPSDSGVYALSYLLPSSATFYGLMDLLNGQPQNVWLNFIILLVHCVVWSVTFFFIDNRKTKL